MLMKPLSVARRDAQDETSNGIAANQEITTRWL
jgi:hypothetical protein